MEPSLPNQIKRQGQCGGIKSPKRFCMVGTRYFESTENIRVFGGFLRARGVFLEKMTAIEAFSRFLGKRFFVCFFTPIESLQWKNPGYRLCMLPNRECNQKQKHKKQPWSNVECFAFGCVTVRFASLETSFHAANHTIPPPPSYEGYPHCPKDKNRSPFHGEKTLIVK